MKKVTEIKIPLDSLLAHSLSRIDFGDAYQANLSNAALTPTELFLLASKAMPVWINALMQVRNTLVRKLGLKDVGAFGDAPAKPAEAYRIGDRLGIFHIMAMTENELVMGIDDSHLDVRVSVLKASRNGLNSYVVSTAVKVHNWLGHVYMLPVGRIHPLVVKAMMRRAAV